MSNGAIGALTALAFYAVLIPSMFWIFAFFEDGRGEANRVVKSMFTISYEKLVFIITQPTAVKEYLVGKWNK